MSKKKDIVAHAMADARRKVARIALERRDKYDRIHDPEANTLYFHREVGPYIVRDKEIIPVSIALW